MRSPRIRWEVQAKRSKEKTSAKCRLDMSDGEIAARLIWSWMRIDYLTSTTIGRRHGLTLLQSLRNFASHFWARFNLLATVLGFFWLSLDYLSTFPTKEQGKRLGPSDCDAVVPSRLLATPRLAISATSRQESKPEQYFSSSGRAIIKEKTAFIFATTRN